MKALAVLIVTLFVAEVHSTCSCYETAYKGSTAPLSNAFNSDTFGACYDSPCSFVADSGDSRIWMHLRIRWGTTTNSNGLIQIYDGTSDAGTPIIVIKEGENVLDGSAKSKIQSTSSKIYIKYTQDGTNPNVYYGTLNALHGSTNSPVLASTTNAPRQTYSQDPELINHDLFVIVNQKTNQATNSLTPLSDIIMNIVNLLRVTKNYSDKFGTRLGLATLTFQAPFYAEQGDTWNLDTSSFLSGVPNKIVSFDSNIDSALSGIANQFFNVTGNGKISRKTAQRTILLLTSSWPTTLATLNDNLKDILTDKGVELLIVGYNLSETEKTNLLRADRWYNAINLQTSDNTATASFVNPFFFNDGSMKNYWCPSTAIYNGTDKGDQPYFAFFEPTDYEGPDGLEMGNGDWSNWDPYNGERSRYCNFESKRYIISRPEGAIRMRVYVYYELEAGQDFLNFYNDNDELIITFSGLDFADGYFTTTSTSITAEFVSNHQIVYRGFFVRVYPEFF